MLSNESIISEKEKYSYKNKYVWRLFLYSIIRDSRRFSKGKCWWYRDWGKWLDIYKKLKIISIVVTIKIDKLNLKRKLFWGIRFD
jgi:hypothetical protein